ncbi:DUF427 domain-containing protein [Paroceanicella profunda]|uniref:DUF427 domain-containing protein n=1 Tax=Paroceanicella profunda TaxID=2579971 RepID=A0A5B8FSL3_9RHOB|nr:DUF427 domain-containing protein [Paroceanicella profunda]QDL91375.1 DUF427 domain-containing protein [Paroceanicella profunda]
MITERKITIIRSPGTWVVRAGGAVIAETRDALQLIEGDYPPVTYFPREDAGMAFLEKSAHTTTCPWKGEATHYDIAARSGPIHNAAWSYEDPLPAAARVKGYIAFYPETATVEQV